MEVCLGLSNSKSKHSIVIKGKPIAEYVNSDNETLTEYTYAHSVSINMIETVDCDGSTTRILNEDGSECEPYNIIIHSIYNEDNNSYEYTPDVTKYYFKNDGWYRFTNLVIPTKSFFVNLGLDGLIEDMDSLRESLTVLFGDCQLPERVVAFDTEKYCFLLGELYSYRIISKDENNNDVYSTEIHYDWKQISFDEVLCISLSDFSSTIRCSSEDIINYSYLEEAYLNKATDLLKVYQENVCSQNCNNFVKENQSDILIRDYYWMALNAVKYAYQLCNYCKALLLLSCVSQCNSNSSGDTYCFQVNQSHGCGCS